MVPRAKIDDCVLCETSSTKLKAAPSELLAIGYASSRTNWSIWLRVTKDACVWCCALCLDEQRYGP